MYRPSLDCIDVAGCSSARVYHQNTVGENCDNISQTIRNTATVTINCQQQTYIVDLL